MAELSIESKDIPGAPNARLTCVSGAIDATTVTRFQETLDSLKDEGVGQVVLDLSGVKYVNSTGLGSLVKYADTFRQSGGGIALIRVPPKVKIVIEMLGLHAFFVIEAGVQQALQALEQGSPSPVPAPKAAAPATPTRAPASPSVEPAYSPARPSVEAPRPAAAFQAPAQPPARARPAVPAPTSTVSLPVQIACRICNVALEIAEVGNFRCPRCQTLLALGTDGRVRFFGQEKQPSVSLSLVTSPECADGLRSFVGSMARRMAFADAAVSELEGAILEICHVLRTRAHGGQDAAPYHVLLTPDDGGLRIHISTHGEDLGDGATQFPRARAAADEFELRRHPAGGTLLRLVKHKH